MSVDEPLDKTATGRLALQFASFASVGALGFAIDAILFFSLTHWCDWPIHWARALSALCSITTTWVLNRHITFSKQRSRDRKAEYLRYLVAQILGLAVNLGVFAICLSIVPPLRRHPIVALMVGASAALLVNFFAARSIAFRSDTRAPLAQCRRGDRAD